MLADGVAVGHAGHVVGDGTHAIARELFLKVWRQQPRLLAESRKEIAADTPRLGGGTVHSIVAIQVVHQEALELLLLTQNRWTEIDQCGRRTHLVDRLWTRFGNVLPAAADHIVHERV